MRTFGRQKSFVGLPPRVGDHIDLIIARENTEGFYSDRSMFFGRAEFMPSENMALSVRKITRKASTRIARTAFALAAQRRKITVVHKANVFRVSDGLFLEAVRGAVRDEFPDLNMKNKLLTLWLHY